MENPTHDCRHGFSPVNMPSIISFDEQPHGTLMKKMIGSTLPGVDDSVY
jgi:hypothetical protein